MNKERIVITPSNPAHHLEDVIDKNGVGHCFLHAVGVHQINEMSDYVVHAGDMVQYHVHTHGNELFIVTKGSVDAILGGKRTVANVGDMILVRPHTPHAFHYREDGTTWHEVVQQLSLWDQNLTANRMIANCPEKMEDKEFMRRYRADHGSYMYEMQVMGTPEVPPEEVPGFSKRGQYYKKFEVSGIQMRLKYPKWDFDGLKELWEFELKQGVQISWDHYGSDELMVVRKGSVRVEVQGYEAMIAGPEDIISIPDYTAHTITALADGTMVQDLNVQYDLHMMMEDIDITRRQSPEAITPAYLRETFVRYRCPILSISGILE